MEDITQAQAETGSGAETSSGAELKRRARQMQTAAEISRAASGTLNLPELLQQSAELIRERFELYYVGVFLVDDQQAFAWLRAASGEAGKQLLAIEHRLPVAETSMTGWCIQHAQARIALDVGQDAVRFNNPYLPATRSEMALPLITRGEVIGVLSVQSNLPQAFNEGDIAILQSMADQLANAIGNARLYAAAQQEISERKRVEAALRQAEEKYRMIVEKIPAIIYVGESGPKGRWLYISPQVEAILGIPAEEWMRDPETWSPKIHPDDLEMYLETEAFSFNSGEPFHLEYRLMAHDGHPVWMRDEAIWVRGEAEQPVLMHGVLLDITRQKQAEDEMQRAKEAAEGRAEQLATINRITQTVVSVLNLSEMLEVIAREIVELLGACSCEIALVNPERTALKVVANYTTDSAETQAEGGELPLAGDPASLYVLQFGKPLIIPHAQNNPLTSAVHDIMRMRQTQCLLLVPLRLRGEVIGTVGIDTDQVKRGEFTSAEEKLVETIAAQVAGAIQTVRLFEEMQKARDSAESANRAKSTFLANMSHELRTPLNAILGYSEMLQEEIQELGQESFIPDLQKIHAAGRHLLGLINDILDLSKIEAGKMTLYLETFDVGQLIDETINTVQPLVDKNGNLLRTRIASGLGMLHSDQTKVRQCLFNLLSNAAKFTEYGDINLTVWRETIDDRDWIQFRVSDTGIGMTEEQIIRLFQPFTQADSSTTRKFGGTGLGLSISRRFCQMLGGDISVVSQPNKGSTFTFWLPTECDETMPHPDEALQTSQTSRYASEAVVLVIDDDPTISDLLQRYLNKEGFQVCSAQNGEEGLRMARELHPDVITLDVMMPVMDGWTVLASLKADPSTAEIPVIMLTIVDNKNQGIALGAADYLTKPVDRDRLINVLLKYRQETPHPVLIVDDDEATRTMLRRMIEKEGWLAEEAPNGRVGLEHMVRQSPQVILLDLMMPEMDGFEFMNELHQHKDWRKIPVVIVTSKDLSPEERRLLDGQVTRVIQKGTYTRDALLSELRKLVAERIQRK